MKNEARIYKLMITAMASLIIAIWGIGGLLLAVNAKEKEQPAAEEIEKVVSGNGEFAIELYSKLSESDSNNNLFFSPYSISTALAMTFGGARGETERQMAEVLHFTLEQKKLHTVFGYLEKQLNEGGKKGIYELSVANALWGQKGEPFLKGFLELVENFYGGGLTQLDFSTLQTAEDARNIINAWIEKKTKEKIKELIAKKQVDGAILVLTNAIYFKGKWAIEFDKKDTKDAPFHITATKETNVPMMHLKENFKYAEDEGLEILELGYKGEDLSMVLLLPREIGWISELEKRLSAENLEKWFGNLKKREVEVYLPKFKITWGTFDLKEILKAMGMPIAFSPIADFSRMTKSNLFISLVLHKAFVEVNEEGTEAAAATAVVMLKSAMPKPVPIFRADHPFIFIIKENSTGSILFMGKVCDPSKK